MNIFAGLKIISSITYKLALDLELQRLNRGATPQRFYYRRPNGIIRFRSLHPTKGWRDSRVWGH